MIGINTVAYFSIYVYCTFLCTSVALISIPDDEKRMRTCDDRNTFKQVIGVTLENCAEECFRRRRCQWLMYRHGMNYCALKDFVNITEFDDKPPRCLYLSVDNWSVGRPDLGPCNNHTCSNDSRCVNTTENDFICEKSECPPPDEIENAVVLSNTRDIGATNRYKCNKGYYGVGWAKITCTSSATWSTTDFVCIIPVRCPTPSNSYINAELTSIDGDGFTPGTVLHFDCRPGYQSTGLKVTSVCQDSGFWSPPTVECCNENTTNLEYWRCTEMFDAGTAGNDTEVIEYCTNIGSTWTWISWELVQQVRDNPTSYVMSGIIEPYYKDAFSDYWNYEACAAENNATANLTNDTDAQLREAYEKQWTGTNCYLLFNWMDGQPDGGADENCIFYNFTMYYDGSCAFGNDKIGFLCSFSLPPV